MLLTVIRGRVYLILHYYSCTPHAYTIIIIIIRACNVEIDDKRRFGQQCVYLPQCRVIYVCSVKVLRTVTVYTVENNAGVLHVRSNITPCRGGLPNTIYRNIEPSVSQPFRDYGPLGELSIGRGPSKFSKTFVFFFFLLIKKGT